VSPASSDPRPSGRRLTPDVSLPQLTLCPRRGTAGGRIVFGVPGLTALIGLCDRLTQADLVAVSSLDLAARSREHGGRESLIQQTDPGRERALLRLEADPGLRRCLRARQPSKRPTPRHDCSRHRDGAYRLRLARLKPASFGSYRRLASRRSGRAGSPALASKYGGARPAGTSVTPDLLVRVPGHAGQRPSTPSFIAAQMSA